MDNLLQQIPNDNEIDAEQWYKIHQTMKETPLTHDGNSILQALADYIQRSSTINEDAFEQKSLLITKIVDRLIAETVQIKTEELVETWINTFNICKFDQISLKLIFVVYHRFQIGELVNETAMNNELIEKILRAIVRKTFEFSNEINENNWTNFFNETLFSKSMEKKNILNTETNVQQKPVAFEEFFRHVAQQSSRSTLFLNLSKTLHKSCPSIFSADRFVNEISYQSNIPIEEISLDFVKQLVKFLEKNERAVEINAIALLDFNKRLMIGKKFEHSHWLISKIISVNLHKIDFENFLATLIEHCSLVEEKEIFLVEILRPVVQAIERLKLKKNFALSLFDLSKSILNLRAFAAPDFSYRLLKQNEFYPWKDRTDELVELISICASYDTFVDPNVFSPLDALEDIIKWIIDRAETYPLLLQKCHSIAVPLVFRWSERCETLWNPFVYRMATRIILLIDLKQVDEGLCLKFLEILFSRVTQSNEDLSISNQTFYCEFAKLFGMSIEKIKFFSHEFHCRLVNFLLEIIQHPMYNENHDLTIESVILMHSFIQISRYITNENDFRVYVPLLNEIGRRVTDELELIKHLWVNFWVTVGSKFPEVAIEQLDFLVEKIVQDNLMDLISLLTILSMRYSERFKPYFDILFSTALNEYGIHLSLLTGLLCIYIRAHPNFIERKHIDLLCSSFSIIPYSYDVSYLIGSFSLVANYHPEYFTTYRDELIDLFKKKQDRSILECLGKYFLASSLLQGEQVAKESLDIYLQLLDSNNCGNGDLRSEIVSNCLAIGIQYRNVLVQRRDEWIRLDASILVHYIDDTISSETERTELTRAKMEIESTQKVLNIAAKKTCQVPLNRPGWFLELGKLLNHRSDRDWRCLAHRLTYKPNEIKAFSMQNDPCLALLTDWFDTHGTDEANATLLLAIKEINRDDAYQILSQSMTISNSPYTTIQRYPPVFLSFHSSRQLQANRLKDELNEAGYQSQLEDENSDENELESRIRGSKAVLCCVGTEVDSKRMRLLTEMAKPIILLTGHEQFHSDISVSLFDTDPNSAWPEEKFIELLARIRFHLAPNPETITSRYRQWFVAHVDHLIFLKRLQYQQSSMLNELRTIPLIVVQPQIVLLYPWENQLDAISLYVKLTSFGYRVWLDIFQMGSWNPLLESITTAFKQSSCILACITTNYLQSVCFQRELSFVNDVHKPLIPLSLDSFESWPSTAWIGSNAELQSLINFSIQNPDDRWSGKPFQMLLSKLKQMIPQVETDKTRHVLDMQRPQSANRDAMVRSPNLKRVSSAPITAKSRACSLM